MHTVVADGLALTLDQRITDLGITLEEAGHDLGVTEGTVSRWANGKSHPSRRHRAALAVFLGCTEAEVQRGISRDERAGGTSADELAELRDRIAALEEELHTMRADRSGPKPPARARGSRPSPSR